MSIDDFIATAFNLRKENIQQFHSEKKDGVFYIYITLTDKHPLCTFCGGYTVIKEYKDRHYAHLPFFGTPCVIVWHRRRYKCKDDGKTFSEDNPFGPENYHLTYSLLDQIAVDLKSPHKSFTDIALERGVSVPTVSLYADSFLHAPRQTLPISLGIDELHSDMSKYGGSYLCVMVDNKERNLIEILPSRSKRILSKYFESIPADERNRVLYVTIDLWEPYKEVSQKYLKSACIAADPFHVIKHLVAAFSKLRITTMNQCVYNSPAYYLLKHWNKLFIVDWNLDNAPKYNGYFKQKMNYRDLFNLLLNISPELTKAYMLMDKYRLFNKTATEENCEERFDALLDLFKKSELSCYDEFIKLLINWRTEILNSFKRPFNDRKLSNAFTENTNERLRELLDITNGMANFERFRQRSLYCFNEHVFYSITQHLTTNKRKGRSRGPYKKKNTTR